jgi:predicted phosphodiesterase
MNRSPQHLLDGAHFSVWQSDDLIVVGYNSAWHDEQGRSPHHGMVSDDHLRDLAEAIRPLDLSPNRLRLFLVHHHPVQYSDPLPDLPDFSAMTNAGNLLRLLHQFHFDVLIHGHKHSPHFETHSVDGGFPLAILCSGSFSAYLDPRWSGYVNNQFHLVKIEARDEETAIVKGLVESWTYLCGHGWIPSRVNNGIAHKVPFGTYTHPQDLERAVDPVIRNGLAAREYMEWQDVVRAIPRLAHLPPRRVIEALDALSPAIRFRRHGDDPNEIVLLKVN